MADQGLIQNSIIAHILTMEIIILYIKTSCHYNPSPCVLITCRVRLQKLAYFDRSVTRTLLPSADPTAPPGNSSVHVTIVTLLTAPYTAD